MNPQDLINSGMAWHLEGAIGRGCYTAIEEGYCILGPEGHKDYWGSRVPALDEVKPGTIGSVEYANDQRAERDEWPLTAEEFYQGLGLPEETEY